MTNPTIRQRVIERLRELARPSSAPEWTYLGICSNVGKMLMDDSYRDVNVVLRTAFIGVRPGANIAYPLGNYHEHLIADRQLWSGPNGIERRLFCTECADWLERNP